MNNKVALACLYICCGCLPERFPNAFYFLECFDNYYSLLCEKYFLFYLSLAWIVFATHSMRIRFFIFLVFSAVMLIQHWIFLSVGYAINLWWKGNSALWEAISLIPAQQLQR